METSTISAEDLTQGIPGQRRRGGPLRTWLDRTDTGERNMSGSQSRQLEITGS